MSGDAERTVFLVMESGSQTKKRLLLVQVRRRDDPLLEHERRCIRTRLECSNVDVEARNAVAENVATHLLDDFDFLVVGGSGDFSVHHPGSEAWVTMIRRLFDAAIARKLPSFGICFGHQVLGLHFGGEVRTGGEGEEAGTVEVSLTKEGRRDELFGTLRGSFGAHTGHSDYVVGVPRGLTLLGSSSRLSTQIFRVDEAPIYSTQFHPDLTASEAQYRYELFVGSKGANEPSPQQPLAKFDPQQDEISTLLARFVEIFSDR